MRPRLFTPAALALLAASACAHAPVPRLPFVHARAPAPPPAPPPGREPPGVLNAYGQAELPVGSVIAVQGDDLVYSSDARRGRAPGINGAGVRRSRETVADSLADLLARNQGRVEVEDRGYPGDTVKEGLARWADRPHAALVVYGYGYGDAVAGTPYGEFRLALAQAVRAARGRGQYVMLIVWPVVRAPGLNVKLQPYREAVRAIAANQGVDVIDASAVYAPTQTAPAGIDLRPEQYRQIAGEIARRIQVVAARPDDAPAASASE